MSRGTFIEACEIAEDNDDTLTIGGGEPTLYPFLFDFIGLAQATNTSDIRVYIVTNGVLEKPALKIVRLHKIGAISSRLSLDYWHQEDDLYPSDKVIEAFVALGATGETTYENVSPIGRARDMIVMDDTSCCCNDIVVAPTGTVFACGCRTKKLGTIDNFEFPEDYHENDNRCYGVEYGNIWV